MAYNRFDNEITPIKVFEFNETTGALEFLNVVTDYHAFRFVSDFAGVGSFTIEINGEKKSAENLLVGKVIQVDNDKDKQGIIMRIARNLNVDDTGMVRNNLIVSGMQLKGLLSFSVTMPFGGVFADGPPDYENIFEEVDVQGDWFDMGELTYLGVGESHDEYEEMMTEEIMRSLIEHNKHMNVLFFHNSGTTQPELVLETAPETFRGIEHEIESFRFKQLDEALEYLALSGDLGWNLVAENNQLVFKIYEGTDRTITQTEVNPVVFSFDKGNVRNIEYVEDKMEARNQLIFGGAGEGVFRDLVVAGDFSKTGFHSRLGFVDARDVRSLEGLFTRARHKIVNYKMTQSIDVQGFSKKSLIRLGEDYHLGDKVTIKIPEWGLTLNVKVLSVTDRFTLDNAGTLEFEFGTKDLALDSLIKKRFDQMNNEILI